MGTAAPAPGRPSVEIRLVLHNVLKRGTPGYRKGLERVSLHGSKRKSPQKGKKRNYLSFAGGRTKPQTKHPTGSK